MPNEKNEEIEIDDGRMVNRDPDSERDDDDDLDDEEEEEDDDGEMTVGAPHAPVDPEMGKGDASVDRRDDERIDQDSDQDSDPSE